MNPIEIQCHGPIHVAQDSKIVVFCSRLHERPERVTNQWCCFTSDFLLPGFRSRSPTFGTAMLSSQRRDTPGAMQKSNLHGGA